VAVRLRCTHPLNLDQGTVTPLRLDGASVTGMWEGWAGTPALQSLPTSSRAFRYRLVLL